MGENVTQKKHHLLGPAAWWSEAKIGYTAAYTFIILAHTVFVHHVDTSRQLKKKKKTATTKGQVLPNFLVRRTSTKRRFYGQFLAPSALLTACQYSIAPPPAPPPPPAERADFAVHTQTQLFFSLRNKYRAFEVRDCSDGGAGWRCVALGNFPADMWVEQRRAKATRIEEMRR